MNAYKVTVGTSATPVIPTAAQITATGRSWVGTADSPKSFHLYNGSLNTIYLGGSGVTVADGFPLATLASVEIDLPSDSLYAISAAGGEVVNILAIGV